MEIDLEDNKLECASLSGRHRNLPLINFISSFLVLSFSNYFQARRSKRSAGTVTSIADFNQNNISDTDSSFGEIFSFLAKLHQSIRCDTSIPDNLSCTNWFNCIWRSLLLFGVLLIKVGISSDTHLKLFLSGLDKILVMTFSFALWN